jgi:hypothetical protein
MSVSTPLIAILYYETWRIGKSEYYDKQGIIKESTSKQILRRGAYKLCYEANALQAQPAVCDSYTKPVF